LAVRAGEDADRSFAGDINLDQVAAAMVAGREDCGLS